MGEDGIDSERGLLRFPVSETVLGSVAVCLVLVVVLTRSNYRLNNLACGEANKR